LTHITVAKLYPKQRILCWSTCSTGLLENDFINIGSLGICYHQRKLAQEVKSKDGGKDSITDKRKKSLKGPRRWDIAF
jgi:hypothetical protein